MLLLGEQVKNTLHSRSEAPRAQNTWSTIPIPAATRSRPRPRQNPHGLGLPFRAVPERREMAIGIELYHWKLLV